MTQTTQGNEHIRAAAELLLAKAQHRAERLRQRKAAAVATDLHALQAEMDEMERIERLAAETLRELSQRAE
ncbi:MAG TPA: hypothetical protein VJP07_10655 [Dehalococcoidia bacterium]|nr:hypothetical protein [Dehalococcoidia bacterium]